MPEQSTEDTQSTTPWLVIAVVLVILGAVVTVTLGTVEPPIDTSEPRTVQHVRVDLGDWDPFADLGVGADAGRDASLKDAASDGSFDEQRIGK